MPTPPEKKFRFFTMLRALWYFLEEKRKPFVFWSSISFLCSFYQLVPSLIIAKIIDFFTGFTQGDSLQAFYIYVLILGISFAVVSLIRLTSRNKIGDIQADINYTVKVKGFEKLLDYSLTWHDQENTGNKVQRILTGSQAMRSFIRLMGQTGFKTASAVLGICIVFLFLSPLFVIFVVVYMACFLSIHSFFYSRMLEILNQQNKAQEKASGSYYEGLTNVLTIKSLGVKDTFTQSIYASEQESKDYNYKTRKIGITKWKAFQLFNAASIVVFLLMVGNGVVSGVISIGSIFIFYTYLMRLTEAASDSTDLIDEIIEYKSAIERMMPIYWGVDSYVHDGTLPFPKNWQTIAIRNGQFTYKEGEENFTLHELNLEIKKHEKIGIVGHSGGGKSTLAKLLLGLYRLEKGEFSIGTKNFYDIKHSEVTEEIATVLQESEMFNLSLMENITLMRAVSPQLIAKSIKISQLESVIAKMPNGLDTLIGEKGYRVSGGERQRIGIARAICKDPAIFILDEATSSLDSQTETKIQEGLDQELKSKTIISIAHRVSTLRDVDRILVFDKGSIVEEGTFAELMDNHASTFYRVYKSQSKA